MLHILILPFLCAQLLKAEIFTSVQHLTNAFQVERKVAGALSEYLEKTEEHLESIRRFLRDYEQVENDVKLLQQITSSSEEGDLEIAERLAENPLQAYHFAKRLTKGWKDLIEHDPSDDWQEIEGVLEKSENFDYSDLSTEDFKGTAQAIVLLQSIYQLNVTSLVNGNIDGIQTAAGLTASDCFYLGTHSFSLEMYYNAIVWLEQAYTLVDLGNDNSISQEQILPQLNKAYEAFGGSGRNVSAHQDVSEIVTSTLKNLSIISKGKFQLGQILSLEELHRNYEALCRGEQLLPDEEILELKCYYDNRNSPYLYLMPAKVEQHHIDPDILVFHDVISDVEIAAIKWLANRDLSRGRVQGKDRGVVGESSPARVSKVSWMDSIIELTTFENIGRRINALTGLSTTYPIGASETLQMANYGIGGMYNPHVDFFGRSEIYEEREDDNGQVIEYEVGDRIATLMFYLSDVNRGGATAFPRLGAVVFPVKGAAVFWHNLKKSGAGNHLTIHGGCPVIHGSKWVANKWIKERAQMYTRPCGLSKDE